MEKWQNLLRHDPLPNLLSSKNQAIVFFAKRDLQDEKANQVESLWELPFAKKLASLQSIQGQPYQVEVSLCKEVKSIHELEMQPTFLSDRQMRKTKNLKELL